MTSLNTTTSKLLVPERERVLVDGGHDGRPTLAAGLRDHGRADVEADHERMAEQIAQPLDLATFATAEVEDPAHSPAWVRPRRSSNCTSVRSGSMTWIRSICS